MNNMMLNLLIWCQGNANSPGKIVPYSVGNISPDMSFLEMFDTTNEDLIYSKATGCALEPSATKDRGCATNHGSHNPSNYRGWSENTFKSYDTNP